MPPNEIEIKIEIGIGIEIEIAIDCDTDTDTDCPVLWFRPGAVVAVFATTFWRAPLDSRLRGNDTEKESKKSLGETPQLRKTTAEAAVPHMGGTPMLLLFRWGFG